MEGSKNLENHVLREGQLTALGKIKNNLSTFSIILQTPESQQSPLTTPHSEKIQVHLYSHPMSFLIHPSLKYIQKQIKTFLQLLYLIKNPHEKKFLKKPIRKKILI